MLYAIHDFLQGKISLNLCLIMGIIILKIRNGQRTVAISFRLLGTDGSTP